MKKNRRPLVSKSRVAAAARVVVELMETRVLMSTANPFTPADIVVERIGTGSGALSSAGTPIFLDEYTPAGVLVQSVALPTATGTGNTLNPISDSGSASTQGLLTLSANGKYLVVGAYDQAPGTASITSSTVAREMATVDPGANINTNTTLGTYESAQNMHGAASPDGTNLYASGKTALGYSTLGSTSTATSLSTNNTNALEIFGNNNNPNSTPGLFGAVTGTGIVEYGTWGSALPTSGTPTATTIVSNASTKPFEFFFATLKSGDTAPDTLYVADATNGLEKFSLTAGTFGASGETWTLDQAITIGDGNNYYGLTGVVNGTGSSASVTLYTTTNKPGTTTNQILSVTDTGGWDANFSSTTPTAVASAATNELINGIALSPDDGVGVIGGLGGTTTAYNNGNATVIGGSATFTDLSDFMGGKVTAVLSGVGATSSDELGLAAGNSITFTGTTSGNVLYGGNLIGTYTLTSGTSSTLTVTFNAAGAETVGNTSANPVSSTAVQALLNQITFATSGATGTSNRTVTFQVTENGGATDTAVTQILTVQSSPLTVTNNTGVTVAQSGTATITNSDLSYADASTTPSNVTYTLNTAPTNGTLTNTHTSTTLTATSTFTQSDINNGYITYTQNGSDNTSDNFAFTVSDPLSFTSSGTFSIAITAPVVVNNTQGTVLANRSVALSTSVLNTTESGETSSQLTYTIGTAPADGTLINTNTSATLTAGSTFTQFDIDNGYITYTNTNAAPTTDSFTFTVTDGGTGSTGSKTFSLTIYHAPVITGQPSNVYFGTPAPTTETFTAAASSNLAPTVQWQVSTNGGASFTNDTTDTGNATITLSVAESAADSGYEYHAVFTNAAGSATTDPATLTQLGTEITGWNFDSLTVATNLAPASSTGTGAASSVGMQSTGTTGVAPYPTAGATGPDVSAIIAGTGSNGGSSDGSTGNIWKVVGTNGWNSAAGIGTQGAQFLGSTVGYGSVIAKFDLYATTQGEGKFEVEYTTDGSTWTNVPAADLSTDGSTGIAVLTNSSSMNTVTGGYFDITGGQNWYNGLTANLSGVSGVNGNANFGIRVVNASTGADCVNATNAALNNTSGNWRFDEVQITGTQLPTPTVTVTSNNSVVYNGSAYVPTAAITGSNGSDSSPSLSYNYYADTGTGGTNLGSTAPTNVGAYTVVASSAADSSYLAGTSSPFTFNITAQSLALTAAASNKTYDGSTTATVIYTVTGGLVGSDNVTIATGTGTFASANAGSGIGVTPTGTLTLVNGTTAGLASNYSATVSSVTNSPTANITQATPTVNVVDANGIFTGSPFTATATVAGVVSGVDTTPAASLGGVMPTVTYYSGSTATGTPLSGAPSAIGTYTVVANFGGSTNYASASSGPVTFTISSLPTPTVTVTSGNRVYNQSAYTPTTTVIGTSGAESNPAITYTYYLGTGTGGTSLGASAPINAGTYTVVAHFAGDSTYVAADSSAKTFNITAVALTATATGTDKTYDQTTVDAVSISLTGVLTGDTVTASGTGAFSDKNVGTGKTVNVSGITLAGASAGNYSVSATTTTTATITALAVTATATGTNRTYDGTTTDTVSISLTGVLTGDTVTATGTGAFASANIGTAKTVSVNGITLAGSSAGNYSVNATTSTTANITALALTPSITAINKTYDGTITASVTYSLTGIIGSEAVTASGTATFASKNIGTGLTVSATGITLSGAAAGNYTLSITTANTTANITAVSLTATITANNKTYDGSANAGVTYLLAGIVGSDVVTASGTATFASANAGAGIAVNATGIFLSGVASANYTLSNTTAITTANIIAKSVSATLSASNKTYDGTTTASVTYGLSGLVGSDAVTVNGTAAFASANAGTDVAVNATGITLSGTAAGNYTLSSTTASTTANITPVALTATIAAGNKTYNATTAASVTYALAGGFVGSDGSTVTASGTATFSDKNVGTAKTVTATGITLSGTGSGNYSVNSTATTTANITALAITGSITAADKQVDGTNAATILTRTLSGVITGDMVSYVGGTATFASSTAGTGIVVTATGLSLTGADAGNYTVNTTATTTANIITPIVYSYVTDQSVYNLGAGQTVTVKVYLLETLNGNTSLIDGNGENGLLGAGFEAVSGTQPSHPSLITAANYDSTDFAGAPVVNVNNSAVSNPNEADVLENVAITATTGVELANGNGAASDEVYLGSLTITGGSALGATTFQLGEYDVSGLNGGNTITNPDGIDVDTSGTVNGIPYTGVGSTVATFTVNTTSLPTPTVTVSSGNVVYNGNAYVPSATVTGTEGADSGATESYTYYAGTVTAGQLAGATPLGSGPVNAGTYTAVANFAGDSEYAAASSAPSTFQITPASVTVTSATVAGKTYDGTTTAAAPTITLSGVVAADAANVSASGSAAFASANAGTGITVNITGITLTGSAAGNYSLASTTTTTTATIAAATPVVTAIAPTSSPYNATATVTGVGNVTLTGYTPTFVYTNTTTQATSTTAPTAPGTYSVVASVTASGNYAAASSTNSATFTIPQIAVAPTLVSTQVGNGAAQRSTVSSITVVFNEAVNFTTASFTLSTTQKESNGYTAISASALTVSNPSGDGKTWVISCKAGGSLDRTGASAKGFFVDAIYQLTLNGAAITDAATGTAHYNSGNTQIVNFNNGLGVSKNAFSVLYGDMLGNGTVNVTDFGKFKTAFGSSATGNANSRALYNAAIALDWNGDGLINLTDYGKFKLNFGKSFILS